MGAVVPVEPDEAGVEVEDEEGAVAPPDGAAVSLPVLDLAGVAALPSTLPFSEGFSLLE